MSKFSIIMRTTGAREITLRRAINSVLDQTFKDYELIIVVDNEDKETANKVRLLLCNVDEMRCGSKVKIIPIYSYGFMEVASNSGIKNSNGEYICIHDDDDSWEPTYLEEVNKIIEENSRCKIVISHHNNIYEKIHIEKSNINIIPYIQLLYKNEPNNWLQVVDFYQLMSRNLFPPIAITIKREVYNDIGLYNEELPVLGDWEYLLKCRKYLINTYETFILEKPLANYHHRIKDFSEYGNSVHDDRHKLHLKYDTVIRNNYGYTSLDSFMINQAKYSYHLVRDNIQYQINSRHLNINLEKNCKLITDNIQNKKIAIFGIGKFFENLNEKYEFYDNLLKDNKITLYDSRNYGKSYKNKKIFNSDNFKDDFMNYDTIIIATEEPWFIINDLSNNISNLQKVIVINSKLRF